MTQFIKLPCHWLYNWFVRRKLSLTLRDNVVWLSGEGEKRRLQISTTADITKTSGFLFSTLTLRQQDRKVVINRLSHATVKQAVAFLHAAYLTQQLPQASRLLRHVKQQFKECYIRNSQWQLLKGQVIAKTGPWLQADRQRLNQEQRKTFATLEEMSRWTDRHLAILRDRYVTSSMRRFQAFFDEVEANPLTERQRLACIIDDDNNLVLAGAGTGKTSTMVGRAGYLMVSGQAAAKEVLLLAFARKAATEMDERIRQRLKVENLSAMTFHSLGLHIIGAVEKGRPSLSPLAEDNHKLNRQVSLWFNELLKHDEYKAQVVKYFSRYLRPAINPFAFKNEGEYLDSLEANDMRSLKGDAVKGYGECLIANFLYRMGVEYEYEAVYCIRTRDCEFRDYHPDFYLPEYNLYIEHFGIDRNGETAPYIDRAAYHRGMEWKRALHKKHQTGLIETYHYETSEETLLKVLEERLTKAGVFFDPLPDDAILADLHQLGAVSEFSILLSQLLMRYKSNWFTGGKLEQHLAQLTTRPQVQAALELLQPIQELYAQHLQATGCIDFEDMIGKAIKYIESGQFNSPWRYILVDEFQDISDSRARLIKALRKNKPDCSIFCVGDDWQAIYRFTGSDLGLTTHFEAEFGPTQVTALDKTFRFNDSISDIASTFVMKNPIQRDKQMVTLAKVDKPAVSLLRQGKNEQGKSDPVVRALEKITARSQGPATVYLLARFNFFLPDRKSLNGYQRQFPNLTIEAMSIHASKGKEADFVIVLGMEVGKHGFPSEKHTHPLLEALLPPCESFPFAEERRLFYVALTRARHRVYLVADMSVASHFVVELLNEKYPIELDEFDVSLMQRILEKIRCQRCHTGTMELRRGPFGHFFGCSHFPRCKHTEKGCAECGMPMHKVGDYYICVDPDCGNWRPACPKCCAIMNKRHGHYGEFWGCSNYHGQQGHSCDQTCPMDAVSVPALTSGEG